ncbi:hypothetical protein I203_106867 [Kwoniella mangroviensis CBS 8507]|uniref:hypothetical protein n=1 Tax=Kwoniella mangroviensis CBS 8507 TaxID=1296122 RepID=UPI00303BB603
MLASALAATSVSTASPVDSGAVDTCDTYRACGLFTEPLSEWDCQKWQAIGDLHKDELEATTAGNATIEGETLEKRYPCSQCPSFCAFARGTEIGSIGLWSACIGTCYVTCY